MQLTCPNCGENVSAENINIQEMVAVCANCNTVFSFGSPQEKVKRRKVKQPEALELQEGDQLEMSFRTNWRLDRNETFLAGSVLSGVFSFMTLLMVGLVFQEGLPFIIPLFFALAAGIADYSLASLLYNKTHISMNADHIEVARRPIPTLAAPQKISLYSVNAIHVEETENSKREGYDTPRFRVWAETVDGVKRTIVTDLVEEYAYFWRNVCKNAWTC